MHGNEMSFSKHFMLANKLLSVALILYLGLSTTSSANPIEHDVENKRQQALDGDADANSKTESMDETSGWSLIDWSLYKQKFGKNYSSLSQQLLRQKIFMSKQIQVFLAWANFTHNKKGYFIAINQFSDLTPDEEQQKLSGDGGEYSSDDEDDDDIMDDEEARRALLEALEEEEQQKIEARPAKRRPVGRRKRSLMGDLLTSHLDFNLVRLPSSTNADTAELKIQWLVPSNNPDYQQVDTQSLGAHGHAAQKVPDIPKEDIEEIVDTSSAWLALPKLISDTAKSTVNWLRSNSFKSKEEARGADLHTATSVGGQASRAGPKVCPHDTVIIDWRTSGCIAPPIDQRDCQSCYAISSMGFLEWAFCMNQNRTLTPLSVQYLVSCGPQYKQESDPELKIQFYGCERGRSRQAMLFVEEYGAELAAHMPYLARNTACPIEKNTPLKHKGYIRPNIKPHVRMAAATRQLELALNVGPVIVNFREPMDFLAYGGGMVSRCYQRGGHAMLIVGHGVEDNIPYLLIKNSLGTDWGMKGYFKFDRRYTEECIKDFILPRVSFPSKKAQTRRMKAYLAGHQQASSANLSGSKSSGSSLEGLFDVGAGGLFN